MRWLPSEHSVRLVVLSSPLEVRERDCHFPGIPQLISSSGGGPYQHLSASQALTINPYSFLLSPLTITLGLIREWIHILGKDGICFADFVFHLLLQTWFGPLWSHLWYSCIFFWKTWDPFSYRPAVQIFFRSNILLPLFFFLAHFHTLILIYLSFLCITWLCWEGRPSPQALPCRWSYFTPVDDFILVPLLHF